MSRLTEPVRAFFKKGDLLLLALCLAASCCGLVLIYSATRYDTALHVYPMRQAAFTALGVAAYFIFHFIDVELVVQRSWKILLICSFLLLLSLWKFGIGENTGNKSWVYIPGISVSFQPAEIVKLAFIPLLAWVMDRQRERGLSRPSSGFRIAGLAAAYCAAIGVLSGDFGMVLVYLFIFLIMAFMAGVKLRWFLLLGVLAGVAFCVVAVLSVTSESFMDNFGYIINRFTEAYTRSDPQGIGWQQTRSVLAIGSGKLTGQGYLQGIQTQSATEGSLPARHTDEIFAVCGEEFGLVGCLVVLALLAAIILRCFYIGRRARSFLSSYIAIGFGAMLLIQTAINVAVCLYIFPVVGLTLPFISYGGSSVVTLYAATGIVSGMKMRFLPSWLQDRKDL
ncbi:MAG: FtsW/RodA/SpoVE family cell cycle protein [Oscillospiraceae bacterium]|nr:FtsW/RodA/SpoVE family cell cycle protein [Oscillospiraceae bacterium]